MIFVSFYHNHFQPFLLRTCRPLNHLLFILQNREYRSWFYFCRQEALTELALWLRFYLRRLRCFVNDIFHLLMQWIIDRSVLSCLNLATQTMKKLSLQRNRSLFVHSVFFFFIKSPAIYKQSPFVFVLVFPCIIDSTEYEHILISGALVWISSLFILWP